MTARQLPLQIPPRPDYDEAGFLAAASNAAARAWLERTDAWPDRRLALWGGPARGKTHLLRIWTARTGAEYIEGAGLPDVSDITSRHGVAVDDADHAQPRALLHLLNAARDRECPVLLASRLAPARWLVDPRDLASRLRAFNAVEVEAPDDDLLGRLLLRWLSERHLVASEALHDRLLIRLPRSPDVLRAAVDRIDREALTSRKRTVTAAMLRAALLASETEPDKGAFSDPSQ